MRREGLLAAVSCGRLTEITLPAGAGAWAASWSTRPAPAGCPGVAAEICSTTGCPAGGAPATAACSGVASGDPGAGSTACRNFTVWSLDCS